METAGVFGCPSHKVIIGHLWASQVAVVGPDGMRFGEYMTGPHFESFPLCRARF